MSVLKGEKPHVLLRCNECLIQVKQSASLHIRANLFKTSYSAAQKLAPSSRRSAAAQRLRQARSSAQRHAAAAASGAGASRDERKHISVCFDVVCQWRRRNIILLLLTSVHRHHHRNLF
jgi:hypothetical protein